MNNTIIDWGLRDINEMLGVNKFLGIDADTDEYLDDFLEAVAKVNLEEMIIAIAKDYRVKNWRHPVSSSIVVMNAIMRAVRTHNNIIDENKIFLNNHQSMLLHWMGDCYSAHGYALCMEPEQEKGLQIVISFPKLYADFVRSVAASQNLIFNHTRILTSN